MFRRILAFLTLLVLVGISAQKNVLAAPSGVTIAPFLQNVSIGPSDSAKRISLTLTNSATATESFTIKVLDFGSLNETGGLAFAGANASDLVSKYGLASWLQLDKTNVTIEPKASVTISGTITNDDNLRPGGHYAAVLLTAPTASTQTEVTVKQSVASLIFATKTGGEKYDLSLVGLKHNGNLFKFPSSVTLRFQNPGNVHVVPRGLVKVMHSNKVISQGVINEESAYVLPETFRQITVPLNKLSGKPWQLVARYQIRVDYRYDGFDQYASKAVTIRIINTTLLVGFVLGPAIIVTFAYLWIKRVKKSK